jgi:hypothetical protein
LEQVAQAAGGLNDTLDEAIQQAEAGKG